MLQVRRSLGGHTHTVSTVRIKAALPGKVCAGIAVGAIALLWGAIPIIIALEQRLPSETRWLGHAAFHVWTASISSVLCVGAVRALRARRVEGRLLRPVLIAATIAAVTNALEAVAAHPSLRALHDAFNTLGAPASVVLLALLVAIIVIGVAARPEGGQRASGRDGHLR
jgi:hypothetical protein